MRNYSRTIECSREEHADLVHALRTTDTVVFRVLGPGMNTQGIYHVGTSVSQQVGYFQRQRDMRHLVIFSPEFLDIEANPLEKFLEGYKPPKKPEE